MVTIVENFFPEELYHNCYESAMMTYGAGENVFFTNSNWTDSIVKDSFPVLCHSIYRESQLFEHIFNHTVRRGYRPIDGGSVLFYFWTTHSYIPWHFDVDQQDSAITVYLNPEWDRDFGGYFMYEDGSEIKAILPKRNRAVINDQGHEHCTTPVHPNGKLRVTLQIFCNKI